MKPTAEFLRHHGVDAPAVDAHEFRPGWRVHTRLYSLRESGRISAGQYQAAIEFRATWERVMRANSANSALGVRVSGGTGSHAADPLAPVLDGVTRLREIEAAIGQREHLLCFACAVEDCSWAATARLLHRDPHTVRDWTVRAIQGLARAWGRSTRRPDAAGPPDSGQDVHRPVRAS